MKPAAQSFTRPRTNHSSLGTLGARWFVHLSSFEESLPRVPIKVSAAIM